LPPGRGYKQLRPMNFIASFAPFFIVFEMAQLFVAHRYIGPDQIRARQHPLDLAKLPPWWLSVGWMVCLWLSYFYQFVLLFEPGLIRVAALLLIFVSVAGFMLRRVCGLKWGMVVMTIEGAIRVGFLVFAFRWMVFPPPYASRMQGIWHF